VTVAALLYLTVADGADTLDVGGRVTAIVALVGFAYAISTVARMKVQSHINKNRFSEAWIDFQEAVAAAVPIAEDKTQMPPNSSDPYLLACLREGILGTKDIWLLNFWRDRIMDERTHVSASVVNDVTQILESAIEKVAPLGEPSGPE
jgi:hypothetical protein